MIVTLPLSSVKRHIASGDWQEKVIDDLETRQITMKDETVWFCWYDDVDITVCLMEEFISSVETSMTGGKKNYY